MSSVFTMEDQIKESHRTRVYGEFPSGLLSLPSEKEQLIILPDSLSEEQQKGTINVDIPYITWELITSENPSESAS